MKERFRMRIAAIRHQVPIPPAELRLWCPVCERKVEMVTYDEAIRILSLNPDVDSELVAAHSVPTIGGSIWVCKDSLSAE